nr:helix-turn-helix transcriptional regulator [Azospirillum sp. TSA2s]
MKEVVSTERQPVGTGGAEQLPLPGGGDFAVILPALDGGRREAEEPRDFSRTAKALNDVGCVRHKRTVRQMRTSVNAQIAWTACELFAQDAGMENTEDSGVSSVPARLRALRERAKLSVRELADELGWAHSTYSTYEGRFKKPYLPVDKARQIADVLVRHGIPAAEVLELAGVFAAEEAGDGTAPIPSGNMVPADYVAVSVIALLDTADEWRGQMTNDQMGNGVALFCRWYADEAALGRQPQRLTLQNAKSLMGLLRQSGALLTA